MLLGIGKCFNKLAVLTILLGALAPWTARADDPQPLSGRFFLKDVNGQVVTDESYGGKIRVMSFGYTFCPDICPTTLSTMSVVLDHLGADRNKTVFLFVSVDPERDTPQKLKDYLAAFPGIQGLTGSPSMVASAARNFHVVYERQPGPKNDPGAYTLDHTAGIFIMSPDGQFLAKMPHVASPDDILAKIRSYLKP